MMESVNPMLRRSCNLTCTKKLVWFEPHVTTFLKDACRKRRVMVTFRTIGIGSEDVT
jgi:hypothetical protein